VLGPKKLESVFGEITITSTVRGTHHNVNLIHAWKASSRINKVASVIKKTGIKIRKLLNTVTRLSMQFLYSVPPQTVEVPTILRYKRNADIANDMTRTIF
jgi:hypothetical protein